MLIFWTWTNNTFVISVGDRDTDIIAPLYMKNIFLKVMSTPLFLTSMLCSFASHIFYIFSRLLPQTHAICMHDMVCIVFSFCGSSVRLRIILDVVRSAVRVVTSPG
jgi:hypothetical protein